MHGRELRGRCGRAPCLRAWARVRWWLVRCLRTGKHTFIQTGMSYTNIHTDIIKVVIKPCMSAITRLVKVSDFMGGINRGNLVVCTSLVVHAVHGLCRHKENEIHSLFFLLPAVHHFFVATSATTGHA